MPTPSDLRQELEVDLVKLATTLKKWADFNLPDWDSEEGVHFCFSINLMNDGEVVLSTETETEGTSLPYVGYPLCLARI
jgi:hypothetical protein